MIRFRIISVIIIVFTAFFTIFLSSFTTPDEVRLLYNEVLQKYASETNAVNSVTSIYLNYRVFDTIFETLMLLVSVMGVIHFSRHHDEDDVSDLQNTVANINFIALIIPVVIMLGIYLILNGHISPGGGFQGGAALAASLICIYLINPQKPLNFYRYERMEKVLFLCIATFATTFAVSNLFLSYTMFNEIYLIIMNILIGLKVYLGISVIFFRFVHYEDK